MATSGRSGDCKHAPEVLELFLHQQTGRRLRHEVGDAVHRRMRAMRRAKRVVHVKVGERRELLGKRRIVLLFLRMKSKIFQQHHAAAFRFVHLLNGCLRLLADAVVRKRDGAPEQPAHRRHHRLQAVLRIHLALRTAEVRGQDRRRAVVQRVRDRRQRRSDARVVADFAVFERHVEVDADEHTLAAQIEIANGKLHRPRLAMNTSRSTQRFE